jgi:hypothetical protein
MAARVCRLAGVCRDGVALLRVTCHDGVAACDYSDVAGFSDPESACDGRDENCDGVTDEGCVTPKPLIWGEGLWDDGVWAP